MPPQPPLPAVLKTRTLGYDGKGQKVLRQPADVQGAFAELGSVPCILEGFVPFTGEVSLAVRARDGETRFYPLVHNTHDSGILKLSVASSGHPLQALAEDYVGRVLARLDYVGVLAFEFFEVDGGLKANEIARACTTPGTGPSKAPSAASSRTTCAPSPPGLDRQGRRERDAQFHRRGPRWLRWSPSPTATCITTARPSRTAARSATPPLRCADRATGAHRRGRGADRGVSDCRPPILGWRAALNPRLFTLSHGRRNTCAYTRKGLSWD